MKFLVGYNGTVEAKAALSLARDFAKIFKAEVFVMASLEGGAGHVGILFWTRCPQSLRPPTRP